MFKPNLNQVGDVLNMALYTCPKEVYKEDLSGIHCNCSKMSNCFECWLHIVSSYQSEQSLKSMNDEEDN